MGGINADRKGDWDRKLLMGPYEDLIVQKKGGRSNSAWSILPYINEGNQKGFYPLHTENTWLNG